MTKKTRVTNTGTRLKFPCGTILDKGETGDVVLPPGIEAYFEKKRLILVCEEPRKKRKKAPAGADDS